MLHKLIRIDVDRLRVLVTMANRVQPGPQSHLNSGTKAIKCDCQLNPRPIAFGNWIRQLERVENLVQTRGLCCGYLLGLQDDKAIIKSSWHLFCQNGDHLRAKYGWAHAYRNAQFICNWCLYCGVGIVWWFGLFGRIIPLRLCSNWWMNLMSSSLIQGPSLAQFVLRSSPSLNESKTCSTYSPTINFNTSEHWLDLSNENYAIWKRLL